jgi:hypothetical protein
LRAAKKTEALFDRSISVELSTGQALYRLSFLLDVTIKIFEERKAAMRFTPSEAHRRFVFNLLSPFNLMKRF